MRILLLNQGFPPDSTATAQHLGDVALHLRDLGHQVMVIADRHEYERGAAVYPPRANWYGVDVWRVATTAFGKRSRAGRLLDGISFLVMVAVRLLFLPRPDLVVSLTSPPLLGFVAAIYARARRVHFTHWLMDLNIDAAIALGQIGERSLLGRVLLWGFRYSLSQSDRVVVEDRFTGERAILAVPTPIRSFSSPVGQLMTPCPRSRNRRHAPPSAVSTASGTWS